MKISIYSIILPRLEVFFLEEWIDHHLKFGVDHIYIYDAGLVAGTNKGAGLVTSRELKSSEWNKKPDADYFLDYSDKNIYEKLKETVDKHRKNVTVTNWRLGIECCETENRHAQVAGYQHCLKNNQSDWWIHIDPDEFMYSRTHKSLSSLLIQSEIFGIHSIHMGQRVFDKRKRNHSSKEIRTWGYDAPEITKSVVRSPLQEFNREEVRVIHKMVSQTGTKIDIPMNTLRVNHYRGMDVGKKHEPYLGSTFDKIDDSMKTFIQ
jgi:hypothetical protein